jgi:hypothetical protein
VTAASPLAPTVAPRGAPGGAPPPAAERSSNGGHGVPVTWAAIGFYVLVTIALLAGVGGRPAAIAYLGVSAVVGIILLWRDPVAYVNFALWLWFLTPFVRRVLDYRHGWNPTSPALLAPPLVAIFAFFPLMQRARELRGALYAPFLLVFLALAYGYSVGMINAGFFPASYALLTWLAPTIFGLHLAVSWRRYPEIALSMRRMFAVAVPILAAYAIYQFVRIPAWDAQWMRNANMLSIGSPLPFLVRVFGTFNTPGPLAAFLLTGVLFLLPAKGWIRYPGIALSLVAMLLTRTRAAWVAFIIGLVVAQLSQPIVRLPKRTITILVVTLLALPLAATPKFKNVILPRLTTLTNLRADNSFIKRVEFSQSSASNIVETAEGSGLGMTGGAIKLRGGQGVRSLDNGFLEVFYVFGWPGGALFFMGIGALLLQSARFVEPRIDPFANAARASTVALISILPIGEVFTGPTGMLLWSMAGLSIAARAHHRAVRSVQRWREAAQRSAVVNSPTIPPMLIPAATSGRAPLRPLPTS